jgi:serine phosphatase RsbU (regulator of sigma subunit)
LKKKILTFKSYKANIQIALFLMVFGVPYVGLFLFFGLPKSALTMIALFLVGFVAWQSSRRGYHVVANFTLIFGVSSILFAYSILLGPNTGAPLIFFPIISLALVLFEANQVKYMVIGCSIPIIERFTFDYICKFHPDILQKYGEPIPRLAQVFIYEFAVLTAFAFTFYFVYFYFRSTQAHFKELEGAKQNAEKSAKREHTLRVKSDAQSAELEIANKELTIKAKMEKEIKLAAKIQMEILPPKAPTYPNYHLDHAFLPAGELSGDYYDYIWLSPTRLAIVVADIVGKGLPASLMMVGFKEIFHHHLNPNDSPAVAMAKLNNIVCQKQIMSKYVPVIYAIIDFEAHTLTYTNAGHEPGKLFTEGVIKDLSVGGTPLGMMEDEHYDEETHVLNPGDRAILYTDGLTDMRNQDGDQLGIENVLGWMQALLNEPSTDFVPHLIDKGREFFKNTSQADDITLVTIKRDT